MRRTSITVSKAELKEIIFVVKRYKHEQQDELAMLVGQYDSRVGNRYVREQRVLLIRSTKRRIAILARLLERLEGEYRWL